MADVSPRLSVIVPFHRDLSCLRRCLDAITASARTLPPPAATIELIVVADGASDDPARVASQAGAILIAIEGPQGPAVARSRGAARATGEILVFVDSDVAIHKDALARLAEVLAGTTFDAAFGAYDDHPSDPSFMSQGKNLAHAFIHRRAAGEAQTFWCGLGAVRAALFHRVGGFDERFRRPSVEDIDLGYRIRTAGSRILLDPQIQGQHMKRWTLRSAFTTDVRDRGVPWTQLLHRYGGLHNDLNLTWTYRVSVVLAYLLVFCLLLAWRWPALLLMAAGCLLSLWWCDRSYYGFFVRRMGAVFTLAWFPVHILHHLCNGVSFVVGNLLYACRRWLGLGLPGALPLTPWNGPLVGGAAAPGPWTGAAPPSARTADRTERA